MPAGNWPSASVLEHAEEEQHGQPVEGDGRCMQASVTGHQAPARENRRRW
jgi:hypothetical protein